VQTALLLLALCACASLGAWLLRRAHRAVDDGSEESRLAARLGEDAIELARRASAPAPPPVAAAGTAIEPAAAPAPATASASEDPLAGAEIGTLSPEQRAALARLLQARPPLAGAPVVELRWARATATHVVWCELRRPLTARTAPRELLYVARMTAGELVDRSAFG
jgi:hypothetical protein